MEWDPRLWDPILTFFDLLSLRKKLNGKRRLQGGNLQRDLFSA